MRKRLVPFAAISVGLICVAGTAYYLGWLNAPGNLPDQTKRPSDLPVAAGAGPNAGGTPNKRLRETSPGVVYLEPGLLHSPDLPPGGRYRIFTFESKDEESFTFTAANKTSYGLFAASSPKVVEDENGGKSLPPSTTLDAVWRNEAKNAGAYTGTNKDLVLRDDAGRIYFSRGFGRSAAIPGLRDLLDGQSTTMPGDAMPPAGTDVLWLFFTTPTGDSGFIVVADTSPQVQSERRNESRRDTAATLDLHRINTLQSGWSRRESVPSRARARPTEN
jgi:hypothetical protein